jgi:hypothetical protein
MAQWRKVVVSGSNAVLNEVTASGNIVPKADNGSDLGSSTLEWKDLYIDGTANVDTLSADTAAIGDLTSGRVVIAGTSGELQDDGDLTFATDTLTATKIGAFEAAGSIDFSDENMTNVDIDSGAIDGTPIGANSHQTIKGTTIDATTDFTIDGLVLTADTITNDAALTVVSTGLTLNASLDIALSADGGNVTMDDGTITVFDFNTDVPELKIMDDAQVANYASIAVGDNGATTFTTVDADAAAANLLFTIDGTVDIDSAGLMTLDSGGNIALEPAGGSHIKLDDVIQVDSGVVTGATSITSTNFVGIIDGALGSVTPAAATVTTLINASTVAASNITGSFTGSFVGDGSNLTGVAQDIDSLGALGSATVHQTQDYFHFSDNGTEKKVTFSNVCDSLYTDISGDVLIAAGGTATIQATSVENSMLADDAVDSAELAAGAVDDAHLSDGVATGLAGTGMTATSGVLNVIGGTGITANANEITTTDGDIVHDNLSGFVANEHIDHTAVTLTAGDGMTGGGDISSNRTFTVVGGDGITANANDVAVTAAQTTITSVYNTSLKVGRAASQEYVDFSTDNEVNTKVNNTERHSVTATGVDITGTLTISGDLDVNGTTTTIDTTNLTVADKFAIFGSGSTSDTDGGIIVKNSALAGYALGYDSGVDRWALDADLVGTATDLVPDAYMGVVEVGTGHGDSQAVPIYGGTTNGVGTIYVDTDDSEIWIYA